MPVIKHLDGIATYVDDPCDMRGMVTIADNAKTQKYSPCNATEACWWRQGWRGFCRTAKSAEDKVWSALRCSSQAIRTQIDAMRDGWRTLPRKTGIPNTGADHQYQRWSAGLMKPLRTSNRYSSHHHRRHRHHPTIFMPSVFCGEVDSSSVMVNASAHVLPTDLITGWVPKSASARTNSMRVDLVGIEGLTSLKYVVLGHGEIRR